MPVRNNYTQRIRDCGERFLTHLCHNENFKETWDREELKILYRESGETLSFSRVLYLMSRYPPRLLYVRRGTTVHFKRPAADRFYWTQLLSAKTDLIVDVKCNSERSSMKQVDRTHYVCEVHSASMPCTLEINFTSVSDVFLLGFSYVKNENFLDSLRFEKLDNEILAPPACSIPVSECGTIKLLFHFKRGESTLLFALLVDFITATGETSMSKLASTITEQTRSVIPVGRTSARLRTMNNLTMTHDLENPFISGDLHSAFYELQENTNTVIRAPKPPSRTMNNLKMTLKLKTHFIPEDLCKAFREKKRQTISDIPSNYLSVVDSRLTLINYAKKFHLLLCLEELQHMEDIKYYRMQSGFRKDGNLFSVEVPGLAERRPSILRGDRICVREMKGNIPYGNCYEGYVHTIQHTTIRVGFNKSLHDRIIDGLKFDIHFTFNRHPLKLMHRAIKLPNPNMEMFFPERIGMQNPIISHVKIVTKNRDIENNEAQLSAVRSILQESSSPLYLIYGPPGTGKTVTMVESIIQTRLGFRDYHILVCAPSNSACDLLTKRLLEHVDKNNIMRLHAPSRTTIPKSIIEVSNVGSDNEIFFQSKEELMNFKVIVCTLITAGRLASAEFSVDHFNRIFIDESGQSMEPELLVAVSGILSKNGKLILAGDPKQLGPIVRSSIAKTKGLQLSLMERLMSTLPYQKQENGEYNPHYVTKLTKNYRSHEAIVKLPNEEFYDDELEVCADELSRNSLRFWNKLPQQGFPIIFKHVDGKDEREENSPSFFNRDEIDEVERYVTSLLEERRYKVRAGEIGVITPYRKQVQKIRKELNNSEIKVGSVEEFQGQERRVIIISTVRSHEENLKHDAIFHLGFVADPKRFNVAITRAKSLLIIIGNAKLLCKDKYWRKMYQYCRDNGGCVKPIFNDDDILSTGLDIFEKELVPHDVESAVEDMNAPEWKHNP